MGAASHLQAAAIADWVLACADQVVLAPWLVTPGHCLAAKCAARILLEDAHQSWNAGLACCLDCASW